MTSCIQSFLEEFPIGKMDRVDTSVVDVATCNTISRSTQVNACDGLNIVGVTGMCNRTGS
eukprot:4434265-Ditylum_brightwellii.AAC.1